jgi:hypothetical protein
MQIRRLKIVGLRGIAAMDWTPGDAFCCLIGAGDCGKSTVLDGVELLLSTRWHTFTEADFFKCDSTAPIVIEATIGELSKALKSDERFGLHVRGWTVAGTLRDEPQDDDEPVLTVRLTVDATMEPVWEVICDRSEPRTLSNRDRAMFGLVRLSGEDARHLAWGQGSVLARITGDTDEAADRLAAAYRAARASAKLEEIEELRKAAEVAQAQAKALGAYVEGNYVPGLELGRAGLSSGSIALHDGPVPLRMAGLGTRRLATLGVQRSGIVDGAIVLIDEIEHGLEPHRIIGAIAQLRADQKQALADHKAAGQVLLTTHSDVALGEAGVAAIRVVNATRPDRRVTVLVPMSPAAIQPLIRFTPRALFARRIVVMEGYTELGLFLGLREMWPARHGNIPIEQRAVAIADGNGEQAPELALALKALGYETVLFRDSDTAVSADNAALLNGAGIQTIEYGGGLNTERAIFGAADDDAVQAVLEYLRSERGVDSVNQSLDAGIPDLGLDVIQGPFGAWSLVGPHDDAALRRGIADVAARKKWLKDQRVSRGVAPIVERIARANPNSALAMALVRAETWMYA